MHFARKKYTWTWDQADDVVTLTDPEGREMVTGPMQPGVVIDRDGHQHWSLGVVDDVVTDDVSVRVTYKGVNGGDTITVTWRFEPDRCWLEPVRYTSVGDSAIVSLHYFAAPGHGAEPEPGLYSRYLIHPGISGSPVLSPVIQTQARLSMTTWLGRGGSGLMKHRQQWGLPVHYVAGLNSTAHPVEVGAMTTKLSDAFCLGLADLPAGDLFLKQADQRMAPMVQIRGDLWAHARGPGEHTLGGALMWAFGRTYEDAIRAYQAGLVESGRVTVRPASSKRASIAAAPQFNTWGAQLTSGKWSQHFDQAGLEEINKQLLDVGLDAGMFVVDDKWEGKYGTLEPDAERFPQIDDVLDRIRAQGMTIGIWAALLRCDDPVALGLSAEDMLCGTDGEPIVLGPENATYSLLDVTRPRVPKALQTRIKTFVTRFRPVLVKFDFGYEIPDLSVCAPSNLEYAGERYLQLALEVATSALRAADPDIAVMYNSLSPLFAPYVDIHSIDDPWMAQGEYHAEINRRMFFSRLLSELGMPTYGSGGYDWANQIDVWFDTAAIGSIGTLGSFTGDQSDSVLTPRHVAVYNGLAKLARPASQYRVDAIGASGLGGATGGRSSSWVRNEDDEPTMVMLRPNDFLGAPGVRGFGVVVQTDLDIMVGALDGAGSLETAARLGVVVRGAGAFVLNAADGDPATMTMHALDGTLHASEIQAEDGKLHIAVPESLEGSPVSWIEITRGAGHADH